MQTAGATGRCLPHLRSPHVAFGCRARSLILATVGIAPHRVGLLNSPGKRRFLPACPAGSSRRPGGIRYLKIFLRDSADDRSPAMRCDLLPPIERMLPSVANLHNEKQKPAKAGSIPVSTHRVFIRPSRTCRGMLRRGHVSRKASISVSRKPYRTGLRCRGGKNGGGEADSRSAGAWIVPALSAAAERLLDGLRGIGGDVGARRQRASRSILSSSMAQVSSLGVCETEQAARCSASFFESPMPWPDSTLSMSTVAWKTGWFEA